MRMRALLPTILSLAVAGCACLGGVEIPEPKGQRQPVEKRQAHFCPKDECRVTVTVDEECRVSVDPYYLVMAGRGNTKIVWTITGGTFAPDPIRWKQAGAGAVFKLAESAKSPRPSATEISFSNNRSIGVFNYGVTVKRGDRTCAELDPTAINDMP